MMIRKLFLGIAATAVLGLATTHAAKADWYDHDQGYYGHGYYGDHDGDRGWRDDDRPVFRGYYGPPPRYYARPPRYYAPPPVYFAPPVITFGFQP